MKSLALIFALVLSGSAYAQKVDMKDLDASEDSTTTIEIKKNKKEEIKKADAKWEIQNGEADVEGESSATPKEAKAAWKKACKEWEKDFRTENKENGNIVVATNCGIANCGGEAGQKVCTSKATYKVKTAIN